MIKFLKNIYTYDKDKYNNIFEALSNNAYKFRVLLTSLILCCIGLVCSVFFISVIGHMFPILIPTGITLTVLFGISVIVLIVFMLIIVDDIMG